MNTTRTTKLSKLQRAILGLALERHLQHRERCDRDHSDQAGAEAAHTAAVLQAHRGQRTAPPCNGVKLYYAEILTELFGFPSGRDPRRPGGWHFSRTAIGPRRYDAAQSSLSRAVRRLEQRGLVTVYCGSISRWSGLSLTEEAVSTVETFHSLNRSHGIA